MNRNAFRRSTRRRSTRSVRTGGTIRTAFSVAGVSSAALLVGVLPAQAATGGSSTSAAPSSSSADHACHATTLAGWKLVVHGRIQRRLDALGRMSSRLGEASHLTSAHRATLTSLYAADTSGLTALDAKLKAETTCSAVRADAKAVVHDYFVFALVVPQSGLTTAADSGTYGADRLAAAEPAIKKAIDLLPSGAKKAAAQASYDDLVAEVTTATADFSGVGDAVLALTPQTFPTHTGVLTTQAGRTAKGGAALARAVKDARAIQADLG